MAKDKVLVLVHGFIKNSKDMQTIKNFFAKRFEDIISVDLPTTFVSLEVAVAKLCEVLKNIPKTKNITFVAHSMGGIIVCKAIHELNLENVDKCVFIATPFAGSKVANLGDRIPFYSRVLKPNKDLLATDKYLEVCNKVTDKFTTGLIAGNKHSKLNILANICLSKEHDGLVDIKSAFAINSVDRVILNMNHGEIHHKTETIMQVQNFLDTSGFLS